MGGAEGRVVVLLVAVLGFGALREPRLLEASSLNSILLWIPLLVVMAVGQMFVIVTRGIDVSVGSILGLSGVVVAMAFRDWELGVWGGVLLGIGIGASLGFVNAALVAWARIPPIIATLGTLTAYRGLAFIISGGRQVDSHQIPADLMRWSVEGPLRIGGVVIPWLVAIALFVAALGYVFTRHMRAGRALYAIGSNAEAAHLQGVPVRRTLLLAYSLCGALAGLASVMYASRYGSLNPGYAGLDMELTVIAAAVIGGCDVTGGVGSVLGVVLGCMLLGVINVGLAVLGIAADWQLLVYGLVILLALALNSGLSFFNARKMVTKGAAP